MSAEPLQQVLAVLEHAGLEDLRQRWQAVYGTPAPPSFRCGLLARAIAYKLQAQRLGDVTMGTAHRTVRTNKTANDYVDAKPQGIKLIRSWKGELHTVEAVEGSFLYEGETYRSLSAVARRITGTQWNGLVFFGVKGRIDLARGRAA
ncbi:DUF2924 domain-containing protein [uncultured Brevundimonas sp.]|uniref:DUF2924 domain-containing protein n=1 Tax=uncultured Brevundimonas sp. TaxID=213418 RepID=UPI0025EEC4CA|nr:DUF2924 domain-containing protein [uncultured Brevundimonas sp.]